MRLRAVRDMTVGHDVRVVIDLANQVELVPFLRAGDPAADPRHDGAELSGDRRRRDGAG